MADKKKKSVLPNAPKSGPIPKEALAFLENKKIVPSFDMIRVWGEEHRRAFTVSKIMEKDILKDVQDSLATAMQEGDTFQAWKKKIKPVLDKSEWSNYVTPEQVPNRLRVIFDTNMRMARAEGQWERAQRTKDVLGYWEYNLGPSVKHRPEHEALDGMILPIDDPWWDGNSPPSGYGCKCWLRQVSKFEAEELGVDTAPDESVSDEGFDYPKGPSERRDAVLEAAYKESE